MARASSTNQNIAGQKHDRNEEIPVAKAKFERTKRRQHRHMDTSTTANTLTARSPRVLHDKSLT